MKISLKLPFLRGFLEWFCFISSLYFIKLEATVLCTTVVASSMDIFIFNMPPLGHPPLERVMGVEYSL